MAEGNRHDSNNRTVRRLPYLRPDEWYPVAFSRELRDKPLKRRLLDRPLLLRRDAAGRPLALQDRCPQENGPRRGDEHDVQNCSAVAFSAREVHGLVFVFAEPGAEPLSAPKASTYDFARGFQRYELTFDYEAGLYPVMENSTDLAHTLFLHAGIFRALRRRREQKIRVEITRSEDEVVARFHNEHKLGGLGARIAFPDRAPMHHLNRYRYPSTVETEYWTEKGAHWIATAYYSPVSATETRLHAVLQYNLALPPWLLKPLLFPLSRIVLRQDGAMLAAQERALREFDGERYVSTDVDILGREIWRMLRLRYLGRHRSEGDESFRRVVDLVI